MFLTEHFTVDTDEILVNMRGSTMRHVTGDYQSDINSKK